jgi:two-component system, NtrC family, sensor kinase
MQGAKRLGWLPMAGLALVLVSMLAFLYAKTRAHDATSYFANVALLRQIKQLDSRWELDVLKSRMGLNTNYDSLVDPLSDLNQLSETLHTVVTGQQHASAGTLTKAIEAFHQAILEKTRLIEHFKSQNSVLRNSLVFLPTAADDIQKALNSGGGRDRSESDKVSASTNKVLLDSMVYSQAPSDDKATEIQTELRNLEATKARISATVSESLDILASHVRTVLREQPVVNELLSNIAAVPVATRIDDLDSLLSNEQRDNGIQSQRYRRYLLIFATALAALFLYAAVSLIRSHAVINRVNNALQGANSTLEQRVRERTGELHETQNELVTTARRAGMAEIANNVLHNVGNVLNSVNISAGLVNSKMRESKAKGLSKAIQLMNEHAADLGEFLTHDEKGKVLPGYLSKLVVALATEQESILKELGSLTKSIDHIKDIVATQQSYAGATSLVEAVQIPELLEDALRINATELTRHKVMTIKEYSDVPLLLLDKHLVLQILVNLIRNANQAMSNVSDRSHRMTLRTQIVELTQGPRLRVRVEDDGEGIAPDNLSRLFVHGFTTRKNGHGFGLHSCALAAKQMGGTLTAQSDGPSRGAAFTLELPIEAVEDLQ